MTTSNSANSRKSLSSAPAGRSKPANRRPTAASPAKAKSRAETLAQSEKTADKPKKSKLVRDSFTMPENEYAAIAEMKRRFLARGIAVKKSEILRAAIRTLADLTDPAMIKSVHRLAPIKSGRPAKAKK